MKKRVFQSGKALFLFHQQKMKKANTLFFLVFSAILLCSCKTEERRIEHTAIAYLEATSCYDLDVACKHCTPETADGLRIIQERILPQLPPDYIQQGAQAEVKVTGIEIVNDTLAHVAWWKKTPTDTYTDTLKMVKRNGEWLADVRFVIPEALLQ